jgi:hypothetical protein
MVHKRPRTAGERLEVHVALRACTATSAVGLLPRRSAAPPQTLPLGALGHPELTRLQLFLAMRRI